VTNLACIRSGLVSLLSDFFSSHNSRSCFVLAVILPYLQTPLSFPAINQGPANSVHNQSRTSNFEPQSPLPSNKSVHSSESLLPGPLLHVGTPSPGSFSQPQTPMAPHRSTHYPRCSAEAKEQFDAAIEKAW